MELDEEQVESLKQQSVFIYRFKKTHQLHLYYIQLLEPFNIERSRDKLQYRLPDYCNTV